MSLISTIVPAYNASRYLRETLDSVLAQEGVEQEVIVVDDGSTDDTPRIIADYGDHRIRSVFQANAGQHAARNHGARLARGEWLAFLDADDIWLPDKLKSQIDAVESEHDLCFTSWENFGDVERVSAQPLPPPQSLFEHPFETLLEDNPLTMSTILIRATAFRRLSGFDESVLPYCEDWDLWLRYAHDGGRFACVPRPLVRYRWHGSSASKKMEQMLAGRLQVVQKALASPRGRQLPASVSRRALASVWTTSAWFAQPVNRWQAMRWYARALYYRPFDYNTYKHIVKCILGKV